MALHSSHIFYLAPIDVKEGVECFSMIRSIGELSWRSGDDRKEFSANENTDTEGVYGYSASDTNNGVVMIRSTYFLSTSGNLVCSSFFLFVLNLKKSILSNTLCNGDTSACLSECPCVGDRKQFHPNDTIVGITAVVAFQLSASVAITFQNQFSSLLM